MNHETCTKYQPQRGKNIIRRITTHRALPFKIKLHARQMQHSVSVRQRNCSCNSNSNSNRTIPCHVLQTGYTMHTKVKKFLFQSASLKSFTSRPLMNFAFLICVRRSLTVHFQAFCLFS